MSVGPSAVTYVQGVSTTERIIRRYSPRRPAFAALVSAVSITAVGLAVLTAAGCAPAPFADTPNLGISEVWPSRGPAARDHAALIVVRADGRLIFRRFAPLAEKRTYSSDAEGHYTITAAMYRCAGECRAGTAPRAGDHQVVRCSLRRDFDRSRWADYVVVIQPRPPACRIGPDSH